MNRSIDTDLKELEKVRARFEAKRGRLVLTGSKLGVAHPKTLQLSQEVDELHNEYNRMFNQSERRKEGNEGMR